MRFQIARAKAWRWLLVLFGATEERSYVNVYPDAIDVRFGFFYDRIPRADVKSVSVAARTLRWWQYSIGWRTNLAGKVALMGAARDVVRIELKSPRSMFIGLPVRATELFVSMENPDAFVAATAARA